MAIRYLLDEHLRATFAKAIRRHNLVSEMPIDVVRVGDADDLPLGSTDQQVLSWAEREGRILVTQNRNFHEQASAGAPGSRASLPRDIHAPAECELSSGCGVSDAGCVRQQ